MTVLLSASAPITVHPAGAAPVTSTFSENVTVTLSNPTPVSPVTADSIVGAIPSDGVTVFVATFWPALSTISPEL